jgi:hypothetical protein
MDCWQARGGLSQWAGTAFPLVKYEFSALNLRAKFFPVMLAMMAGTRGRD